MEILILIIFLVGIAGAVLPALPGSLITALGVVIYMYDQDNFSFWLWIAVILGVVVFVADYFLPSILTKLGGGSKRAAYGATIGSILGASESGNGDPIVVKQASKQGVTEGSLIGSGFATDYQESFFVENDVEDMELAAKKNILSSINSMNADASLEAMNSLATKKVKTSSRDMLLLIRKFNISPNTTNPATIYQRPTKKKSGDDFPFTDKFPAATPI